jgi:hypothetical protein
MSCKNPGFAHSIDQFQFAIHLAASLASGLILARARASLATAELVLVV